MFASLHVIKRDDEECDPPKVSSFILANPSSSHETMKYLN